MRDLKFACPHCEQHIQCDDAVSGKSIPCPACGQSVVVPAMPDEHHLRISTGRVPIPTHAHGAPRAGEVPVVEYVRPLKPQHSTLAITSLALSCASVLLGPFGCIPGIIFGYLAKAELQRNPRLLGAELAKAGIIVGYCFLAVFAVVGIWLAMKLTQAH
jgi:hypothetical protein